MIERACQMRVRGVKERLTHNIYTVCKDCHDEREWYVSHCRDSSEFKCCCLRFESRGLPCGHTIAVVVHLGMEDIPKTLMLKRWNKGAKDEVRCLTDGSSIWDSQKAARCATLMELYRVLCDLISYSAEDFNRA